MAKLWLDIETFSTVPIKHGVYAYAERAELLLLQYAVDDGPVRVHESLPEEGSEFHEAWTNPETEIWAHNAQFERVLLSGFSPIGFPYGHEPGVERWYCTMIQALSHSLPASLASLCNVLGVAADKAKLADGAKLIHLFCKPLGKNRKLDRATKETHPEEWERFRLYGEYDIVSMRECGTRMPVVNYPTREIERKWYWLDQVINSRGVCVDSDLVDAAIRANDINKARIKRDTASLTDGTLTSTTKRDATLAFIAEEHGILLEDLTKATVRTLLESEDIPEGLKTLLDLRREASATTVAKYRAFKNAKNSDSRVRGMLQFRGASKTGRCSGKVVQLQNLASRGLLSSDEIDFGIDALKEGFAHEVYPDISHLLTSCIRGCLVAAPGKKLVVADLSNIEGRMLAWLANEEWKLKAFRAFDDGEGHDLYNLAYSRAFNVPVESVDKFQRSVGKVFELFLGYSGGVGAFLTGAAGYGFKIEDLVAQARPTIPESTIEETEGFVDWLLGKGGSLNGLTRHEFVTIKSLVTLWRSSNSSIVRLWKQVQEAAVQAVYAPGSVFKAGERLAFTYRGGWLLLRLPSGRVLCYPGTRYDDEERQLSYLGTNQYTRKWERLRTFSGKLVENACQAASADVLYDAQIPAEEAGYAIVLHVHDEIVAETPDTEDFTVSELSRIMTTNSPWAEGLPLAAAGEEMKRYRK